MKTILTTCEHGGNIVPNSYKNLFKDSKSLLNSHRGYDIGAIDLYESMVNEISDIHICYGITRLLIDPNRSLHNKSLFSEITGSLDKNNKQYITDTFYNTYRDGVQALIEMSNKNGKHVIHIAVHTFTPVLNDKERTADVGLLYDPARNAEKNLCKLIKHHITHNDPSLRVRFNYPYLGTSDGFVPYLRKQFSQSDYTGVELEVNQVFALKDKSRWEEVQEIVVGAFRSAILDSNV
ncbi:MAG: N-formylglutamate amidohydrolase [Candidatus Auribacterota bacterium]|jgi:predicted N-formylglutamate amidohydrolase|nr:N-formylglutamate amidohydrolase [Candidatus Auribacterota bacterium]